VSDYPCCAEHRCRRKQPIEIQRGGLLGSWYAITRYKREGTRIVASEKHELNPMVAAALDFAQAHMDEVRALYEQREAETAAHRARRTAEAGERS
jgi:hypothetical protein